MEGKVWTASNGRYLEVRAGATQSINAGGIKVWNYLVVTVFSFLVILPWICWTSVENGGFQGASQLQISLKPHQKL
jgi:uncharacterized membrane protein